MQQFKNRMVIVAILLIIAGVTVIGRLFTIQVLDNKRYAERSRDQTQQRSITPAKRGIITDRTGKPLAVSMQQGIAVEPEVFLTGDKTSRKKASGKSIQRVYPYGDVAGPLLGYVGTDGNGLGGVELTFDRYLRGEDGWVILQKYGAKHRYRKIGLPEKKPKNGGTITLTVDINVQAIVQSVLRQAVTSLNAKNGLCIVMDPHTGDILAMANEPSFNPNLVSRYSIEERQNRCISTVYEPGSTFKVVTASAALQEKIKSEEDLIFGDNGSYQIFNQTIRDHEKYGYLTFAKAMTVSSNICFAKVANEIGNDRFYRYVRDFGFGEKTGIALPGEEGGIVHPVKRWSGRTRVTMAMGQELSTTLLQMMLPYAAIANGGVLVSPNIMSKITTAGGALIDSSSCKPVRRVISEDVAARLRVILTDVVENGTGKRAHIERVLVAGKTGTSQKPDSGGYSQTRSWSSFIGFVPVDKPELLCGVMIDEPARGEMGGEAAAPYFKKIITQVISNPELEFAEKIFEQTVSDSGETPVTIVAEKIDNKDRHTDTSAVGDGLPDCTGKELREAINMVNRRGFIPYAVGSGIVERQTPSSGTKKDSAPVCTLYCSVKG